ncbi:MAG TPA: PrpR N-terminal domain-containing protein [Candidatus Eisenbergiella merdigallinarum]|uniref:PrpR N-terminal domain-containing protein n=1 Tax=Candidatus Eisenbergiella merdigallinarum TaxID=2838552 RepID=A0A9D2MST9_9FIRM|nr:PrpR N-terminal domain-containing protein [Candidatus Eisenbergiella merdigallinarum]
MRKIRILGIAPYEGIKNLMEQAAAQREDIELDVLIGDMEAGAAIASRYSESDLDVIISRGGTAELIRARTAFPVVDIPLSVYDIFRSIKLAENYTDKYALVGFPAITKNAHFLCDMLQYNIDIHTIHNEREAADTLKKLLAEGCHMVLCDMITNSLAQQYGLTSILIASGAESIESAFDAAVQIAQSHERLKSDLLFSRMVLEDHPWPAVAFDVSGSAVFFSKTSSFPAPVMEQMRANISSVAGCGEKKIYYESSGLLYVLNGLHKVFEQRDWVVYYVNCRKVPLALTKNGIRYISREEAFDIFFNSFYGITHSTATLGMSLDQYAQSAAPLVILGETGTGKEPLARLVYAKSRLQNKPLAIIDCARIGPRGWSFLTEHNNSPFSDTGTTIYIKNTSALSDAQFAELISIITDLNLTVKNRMLFTFRYEADGSIPARCRRVLDSFSCLLLEIEPLRSHLDDMPNLASLYISNLNMRLAKEVVGIEPEGIRQLQSYSWPGNYDQFQRIMNELVFTADSPYIRAPEVSRLLRRELPAAMPLSTSLDLHRSLEEINLDILRQVLAEEGGNQSATAKRLGISRTTLWRMLQKT